MSRMFDEFTDAAARQNSFLAADDLLLKLRGNAEMAKQALLPEEPVLSVSVPEPADQLTDDSSVTLDNATSSIGSFDPSLRVLTNAKHPKIIERYRRLRNMLMQMREKNHFSSLLVTSAVPQEGKTLTSLNLALSFAMLPSFKVLVVDADVRRGTMGQWMGIEGEPAGLTNLIHGSAQLEEVLLRPKELPFHVMTKGNAKVAVAELLHSSELKRHFRLFANYFDLIVVDSPPVTLLGDVQLIAKACDAVVLVARAYFSTQRLVEKAVQDLNGFRLLGTILNAGENAGSAHGYAGYYYPSTSKRPK